MWPWEHAAAGYIAYSLLRRAGGRGPPTDGAALAVLVGTQVPDLVDKPLAWGLGVLPGGRSLAHSLLVAVPVVVAVLAAAHAAGRRDLGTAFGVGYLLHLPGDVVYPVLVGHGPEVGFLLYPLVPSESDPSPGLFDRTGELLVDFAGFLTSPVGTAYLLGETLLLVVALWLWLGDGRPGFRSFGRRLRQAITG